VVAITGRLARPTLCNSETASVTQHRSPHRALPLGTAGRRHYPAGYIERLWRDEL